jgi:hypothetical protein
MFVVASRAVVIADRSIHDYSVISTLLGNTLLDFHMTGHALQLRPSCAEGVAVRAAQKAVHAAVRLRERTRRNLGFRWQ